MGDRSSNRKATIEIQKRSGRNTGAASTSRSPGETGQSITRQAGDPSEIPKILNEIYVPSGYDEKSSILACNFPPNTLVQQVEAYFSWIGPIIYVERAPSVTQECNFIIVFATPEPVKKCLNTNLLYGPQNNAISARQLTEKPTFITRMSTFFKTNSAPAWNLGITKDEAVEYLGSSAEATATQLRSSATNFRATISQNWQSSGAQQVIQDAGLAVNDAWSKASESISNYTRN